MWACQISTPPFENPFERDENNANLLGTKCQQFRNEKQKSKKKLAIISLGHGSISCEAIKQ